MTKPGPSVSSSTEINPKRKWLFGTVLFGVLANLWLFGYSVNTQSYVLCSETQNIYTVDESRPRVECISVRGSRIIDFGNFSKYTSFDLANVYNRMLMKLLR